MKKEKHDPTPARRPWRAGGCKWGKIIFNYGVNNY
jgi:hypothetical protein